jgi:hypothetical protein
MVANCMFSLAALITAYWRSRLAARGAIHQILA